MFEDPVALIDQVVEVLDLNASFRLDRRDSRRIGTALVDRDLVLQTVLPDRLLVAMAGEQQVDSLTFLVDGAVEVFPLALAYPDVLKTSSSLLNS
jgi:hypothetical protein